MMLKQDLVAKIKDYFNLNIYETKVWLALLSKGVASAGEIAEISRVPRSRTYDVLESLEKKGFAIIKLGKPIKYLGVKPKIILEKLRNNIKKEAEERVVNLSKIKETAEFLQLEEIYKDGSEPVKKQEISAALKGRLNIYNHLKELIRSAKKEVIICTNVEEMKSKAKFFQQISNYFKKSDIKLKIALNGDAEKIRQMEKLFSTRIRKTNIEAKFFIIDRCEVLFYLSKNSDKEDTAIWLNSKFFSEAFASLFEGAIEK
ncbi:MAG: helix-turn-helix domain-containing protein [archaeon]